MCGNIGYPVSLSAVSSSEEDIAIISILFQLERIDDYRRLLRCIYPPIIWIDTAAWIITLHLKAYFENMDSSDALILNKNDEYCKTF